MCYVVRMRIHGDNLSEDLLQEAADFARADLRFTRHHSRTRAVAFEVALRGESRRRPMGGGTSDGYAATWDQWGCFLGYLFSHDNTFTVPRVYADVNEFHFKTGFRFDGDWPEDAHGDHTFRYSGVPFQQTCTKCSAVTRWQ